MAARPPKKPDARPIPAPEPAPTPDEPPAPAKRAYRRGKLQDKLKLVKEPRVRKIVERMVYLDMSQARFCALTGMDETKFSKWMGAARIEFPADLVAKVARALGVTQESLIDDNPLRPLVPLDEDPVVLAIHQKTAAMIKRHGKIHVLWMLHEADPEPR